MSKQQSVNLMGFNIPNVLLYGVIALVLFFVFGFYKAIRNMFKSASDAVTDTVNSFTGGNTTAQQKKNQEGIIQRLEKNAGVQSQKIAVNANKAEQLFEAMNGAGTDFKAIKNVMKSITGPNQAGAVYLYYGVRTLGVFPRYLSMLPFVLGSNAIWNYTGDIIGCLENELSKSELKEIEANLNLFKKL